MKNERMEFFGFPKYKYEYFDDRYVRHDVYEFSKELTEYIHKEKIPNIIFIDRGARPAWVGVDEYWKNNFKNEPRPNYYFVNPESFNLVQVVIDEDGYDPSEVAFELEKVRNGRESILWDKAEERGHTLEAKFDSLYHQLSQQKDQPLLIFDTCSHSGGTLAPVLHFFDVIGYKKMKVITANTPGKNSSIRSDKVIDNNAKMKSCYPFGNASGVKKGKDLNTQLDFSANRKWVLKSRQEIRKIIQDKGK